jgi:hypothetical protein
VQIEPKSPYRHGQVVALAARAAPGWRFDSWQGAVEDDVNPLEFQIMKDMAISARFLPAFSLYFPAIQDGSDAKDKTQESCQ